MNPVDSAKFEAKLGYAYALVAKVHDRMYGSPPVAAPLLREAVEALREAIRLIGHDDERGPDGSQ